MLRALPPSSLAPTAVFTHLGVLDERGGGGARREHRQAQPGARLRHAMSDCAATGFAATGFNSKATWFGIQ
jgi:hypothetical protein